MAASCATADAGADDEEPEPAALSFQAHAQTAEAEQQTADKRTDAVNANTNALLQRLIDSTSEAEAGLAKRSTKARLRSAQTIC